MEKLTLTVKEVISVVIFVVTLAGHYFATRQAIDINLVETRASIQEQAQLRENDAKIMELRINTLQLQIARMEAELKQLQDEK